MVDQVKRGRGRPRKVLSVEPQKLAEVQAELQKHAEASSAEAHDEALTRPDKLNRSGRPKRTPINGSRDILNVQGQEEGFHYCWVNEDKVGRFMAGGYEYVTHDVIVGDNHVNAASQIGHKVSKAVGNGLTAYLMRCPEEYFLEEMALVDEITDKREAVMRQALNSKDDGRYGEVRIEYSKPLARKI